MLSACLHCVTIELFIYEAYIGLKSPQRWLVVGYGSYGKIGFDPIATERRLRRNGRRQRQRRYGIFHVANVISLRKLRWLRNSLRKIRETDYGTDGTDVTWGWKPGISQRFVMLISQAARYDQKTREVNGKIEILISCTSETPKNIETRIGQKDNGDMWGWRVIGDAVNYWCVNNKP